MAPTTYRFGDRIIPSSYVFISRRHVYAMVNPTSPTYGHVIVVPTRVVCHLKELTELETLEIFVCAKEIAKKFEEMQQIRNFSFIIQDGE
jgi:diadenosine tetraphosphate (Ap4A) HIT family hydrolase